MKITLICIGFVMQRSILLVTWCVVISTWASAQGVLITDMNGRSISLPDKVMHTVTTPMPASSVFASVNQGVKGLEGMHPSSHDNLKFMLLATIFPDMQQVRHDITRGSNFTPNVESLLQIAPDLVWQWGHMGDDLLAPIEAAGLKVAALRYGTEAQTQKWITLFSTSLGQPERAVEINTWRSHIHQTLQQQVAGIAANQRQKVMYLSRYKTGMAAAGQSGNFNTEVGIAGGINVNGSKASSPTVNVEQILLWDPDVIVLTNFEHDLSPQTLYKNPMLSQISAVRHKRIYKVPAGGYYWDPPSQDTPLYWIWLAKLMYPGVVNLDLRKEIRNAYRMLYRFEITDAQIDQVLHMDTNQQSQGYLNAFAAHKTAAAR